MRERFDSTWAAPQPYQEIPAYVERRTPQRATIASDVGVPVLQALALGVGLGLAAGTLALLLSDRRSWALWEHAGRVAGGTAVVVLAVALVLFVAQHRALLWQIESMTGRDLDGDQVIGEPETVVRVELVDKAAKQVRFVDLPLPDAKLAQVATAVLAVGLPFSRRGLGSVLSQTEYEALGAAMVKGGLVRDLPGNRRELTPSGRAMLRKVGGL